MYLIHVLFEMEDIAHIFHNTILPRFGLAWWGRKHALQWRIQGGGSGVVGVITPPPLVAENVVCSNSNFSPTGAITPPPP